MKWGKITLVIFGALVITALSIDATDTLRGSNNTLLGQLVGGAQSVCPDGMTLVPGALTYTCADIYEASPSPACPTAVIASELDTQRNLSVPECAAASKVQQLPWRFITRDEAQTVCLRAGKRLPTNPEWHQLALGTPDSVDSCNISGSLIETGSRTECVSATGVQDAVGNVWEWVYEDVVDGSYNGRSLPMGGYVQSADTAGVATKASSTPVEQYGLDYVWTNPVGTFGMIRGGFYGNDADAGVYALHADTPPESAGAAIGFRCIL